MTSDHRLLDSATGLFAGVAVLSFWQGVALTVTIIAALVSITLGCVRIYDRLKYGPSR